MVIGTEAGTADPMAVLETEVVRRWAQWGEVVPQWDFEEEDRLTWVVAAEAPLG